MRCTIWATTTLLCWTMGSIFPSTSFGGEREDISTCMTSAEATKRIASCTTVLRRGAVDKATRREAYLRRGEAHLELDDNQSAIADFSRVLRTNPADIDALFSRSTAYANIHQRPKALADLDAVIRIEPSNGDAFNSRGIVRFDMGEYREAVSDYSRAIALEPQSSVAYYNRGNAFRALNDLSAAAQDYRSAFGLEPDLVDNRVSACWLHAIAGESQAAISECDLAAAVEPDYAVVHDLRGFALFQQNDLIGARASAIRALALSPFSGSAHYTLGMIEEAEGNAEVASRHFQSATLFSFKWQQLEFQQTHAKFRRRPSAR